MSHSIFNIPNPILCAEYSGCFTSGFTSDALVDEDTDTDLPGGLLVLQIGTFQGRLHL